jgi:hypothetical protein
MFGSRAAAELSMSFLVAAIMFTERRLLASPLRKWPSHPVYSLSLLNKNLVCFLRSFAASSSFPAAAVFLAPLS